VPTVIALDVLSPILHPARALRGDVIVVVPQRELAVVRLVEGRPRVLFRGPPMEHMLKELARNGIIRARTPADGVALIAAAPERRRVPQPLRGLMPDAGAPALAPPQEPETD
jgi:hypothetical protein